MRFVIVAYILIFSSILFGQEEYFTPYAMASPRIVDPDTMGYADEELIDPAGKLQLYRKGMQLWLVEKTDDGARGWYMEENNNIVRLRNHDFNGARPELIITWQSNFGKSSWTGGVAEQQEEVVIYDLEEAKVLLHLTRLLFTETWYMQYLEDLDSVDMDTITPVYTGSERYCEEYRISLNDSLVTSTPVYDHECRGIEREEEGQREVWVWRNHAFYRKD